MRVLLSCWPAYGHLLPMMPLARAARRAGHEVIFASGREMADVVEWQGFDFWDVGPGHVEAVERYRAEHPDAAGLTPGEQLTRDITGMFLPSAQPRAADLVPLAMEWKPDLVVHEVSELAGAIAAAHTGARHVVHGLGLFPAGVWSRFAPQFAELCDHWQVPDLATGLLDATYLDIFPPSLQPGGPSDFRRIQPLGPANDQPAEPPLDLAALPHKDTVYLTLGTIFHEAPAVFETVLAGLTTLPVNVIVTLGPGADPARLGPQPPHVLVTDYLPQAQILPHCRLVISHGGAGTVLGALRHGLPQLVLPQGADNFLNAAAVHNAGAALTLTPGELSTGSVAGATSRLLVESPFTTAARATQAELTTMPTPDDVLSGLTRPSASRR